MTATHVRDASNAWHTIRHMIGVPDHAPSWRDRGAGTLIAFLGLGFVVWVSQATRAEGAPASLWLVGSIGATAVLVFAVPHGPLSQPWAVFGGQAVSAVIGITVAHVVGGGNVAKALAVALAIGAMQLLSCVHPPGGATALAAVVMVTPTSTPSWHYPLTPVLLNSGLIVLAAIVLNAPFRWRRYPLAFAFPRAYPPPEAPVEDPPPFTTEQLRIAFGELETVSAISDEELEILYRSLRRQQQEQHDPS